MIVKRIKEIAQRELSGADKQLIDKLWNQINSVFQKWKLEHGDRNPKIASLPLNFHKRTGDKISFEDAEPWECAGLALPSRIGLAYKLWYEDYPEFEEILMGEDGSKALALLITKSTISTYEGWSESYEHNDFFDVFNMLMILQRLKSAKGGARAEKYYMRDKIETAERQKHNLAKGPLVAAKNKAERADKYHNLWREWARDTWKSHPYWEVTRVAEHVHGIATKGGHEMANGNAYTVGTIIREITGIKQSLKDEN